MPSNLESPIGVGWRGAALELLHQRVLERPLLPRGQGSKASSPSSQGNGCLEAYEAIRAFPVPEEEPSPGELLGILYQEWFPFFSLHFLFFYFLTYSFVAYVQAIQEVSVVEEWVKDARNKAKVEANLRTEIDKALGTANQKNQELTT